MTDSIQPVRYYGNEGLDGLAEKMVETWDDIDGREDGALNRVEPEGIAEALKQGFPGGEIRPGDIFGPKVGEDGAVYAVRHYQATDKVVEAFVSRGARRAEEAETPATQESEDRFAGASEQAVAESLRPEPRPNNLLGNRDPIHYAGETFSDGFNSLPVRMTREDQEGGVAVFVDNQGRQLAITQDYADLIENDMPLNDYAALVMGATQHYGIDDPHELLVLHRKESTFDLTAHGDLNFDDNAYGVGQVRVMAYTDATEGLRRFPDGQSTREKAARIGLTSFDQVMTNPAANIYASAGYYAYSGMGRPRALMAGHYNGGPSQLNDNAQAYSERYENMFVEYFVALANSNPNVFNGLTRDQVNLPEGDIS